jgi:A/G-specific adenine glycosylase
VVRHGFTHFELEIVVLAATVRRDGGDGVWVALDRLGDHALPALTKKVVAHALEQLAVPDGS